MSEFNNIKNELSELNRELNKLSLSMKDNLLIDDKIIEEESFEKIINNIENISSDFNNVIIPIARKENN